MSYNMYRRKIWVETSDRRILPLCQYADSSLYDCDTRSHPKSWCLYNLRTNHVLVPKQEFITAGKRAYEEQISYMRECIQKYGPDHMIGHEPGPESYNYFGTTYPGGGKLKHMRAFLAARKTVPVDEFLCQYPNVTITLEPIRPNSYDGYEKILIELTSEEKIMEMEEIYQSLRKKYPSASYVCIGVRGMPN